MNNLWKNQLIYQNGIIVGASLKFTLPEAIIMKQLSGSVGLGQNTARCYADSAWTKFYALGFSSISTNDIAVRNQQGQIINSVINYNENSKNIVDNAVHEFLRTRPNE